MNKGLLTPQNCAVILIDFQPQMIFGVANIERQTMLNNVLVLAKAAKTFNVPVVLTAVETKGFSGNTWPALLDLFPELEPVERSSMNSWDSKNFVAAVKKTGRKNLVMAALWTEACLTFPALDALAEGYNVFAVEDACGGTSRAAHDAAMRRIEQAGAVPVTALQVLLELQRDWARKEHYDEVLAIVKEHSGAYGQGVEYAYTMVHGLPATKFAEYVGPQLIKAGSVSEMMKLIRATEVTKAAVQYQGVTTSGGPVKLQRRGSKGVGPPPPLRVTVQDMISEVRAKFDITDEEALYIRQVTQEKVADPVIRSTVEAHRENQLFLEGPFRGQVNEGIQTTYDERGRYDELSDPKYTDTGGIFDIMAVTVIQSHLAAV